MCANLKHAVLVSAHFHIYQLISAIIKKKHVISLSWQLEFWTILNFPLSLNQSSHTESEYALALCASQMEWILGCYNDSEILS